MTPLRCVKNWTDRIVLKIISKNVAQQLGYAPSLTKCRENTTGIHRFARCRKQRMECCWTMQYKYRATLCSTRKMTEKSLTTPTRRMKLYHISETPRVLLQDHAILQNGMHEDEYMANTSIKNRWCVYLDKKSARYEKPREIALKLQRRWYNNGSKSEDVTTNLDEESSWGF